MPLYPAPRDVLGWFTGRTPVRYGGKSGGVVAVLPVDALTVLKKGTRLVEGQMPCNSLIPGALTLVASRGVLIRRCIPVSRVLTRPGSFGGEGCKKNDGTGAVPYHASRDQRVRWESGRRI